MRGAAALGLDESLGVRQHAPGFGLDRGSPRPDHHGRRCPAGLAHRGEHMGKQRPPRDRMQHLGPRRTHARALAGGEHDRKTGPVSH